MTPDFEQTVNPKIGLNSEQIEKAKGMSHELAKDPDDPKTRNTRLATLHDLMVDKENLKTLEIPNPKDFTKTLILHYRCLTFKELGEIQSKTTKTKINMNDPTKSEIEIIDHTLMAKLLITTQVIEPKISMEEVEEFEDEIVNIIAQGLQKRKLDNFIKLKNLQSPMKQEQST